MHRPFGKKLCFILVCVLLLASTTGTALETKTAKRDEILGYALKKLSNVKKKKYEDIGLESLVGVALRLGQYDQAISAVKQIEDEYNVYSTLVELLNHSHQYTETQFQDLIDLFNNRIVDVDDSFKYDLFCFLVSAYVERKNLEKALSVMDEVKKLEKKLNPDIYIRLRVPAILLRANVLKEQARKMLYEYEVGLFSNGPLKSIFTLLEFFRIYADAGLKQEEKRIISKIETTIATDPSDNKKIEMAIDFVMALLNREYIDKAINQINLVDKYCIRAKSGEEKLQAVTKLLKTAEDNEFIVSQLIQDPAFETGLIKDLVLFRSGMTKNMVYYSHNYNTAVIKFLVSKGRYNEASKKSEELELTMKKSGMATNVNYFDIYHYSLGKMYLKSAQLEYKTLDQAEKTRHSPLLRIELLLDLANICADRDDWDGSLKKINKAHQEAIKITGNDYIRYRVLGNIALQYLEYGFIDKAVHLIESAGDEFEYEKSELLFEVVQACIRTGQDERAEQLVDGLEYGVDIDSYIYERMVSKIGAHFLVDKNEENAMRCFKKAISMSITSDSGSLDAIFIDYYFARKFKKLKIDKEWENNNIEMKLK